MVLALFLRRFWTIFIPSVTIPVSIAATLVAMYFLRFSLDNISLMALTVAVGFVIDDAVIIIENITRLMRAGRNSNRCRSAWNAADGVHGDLNHRCADRSLIPILFMPDIVGRLFREFGLTLVAAIVASALISLTLTPMLCSRLLIGRQPPCERSFRPGVRKGHRALHRVVRGQPELDAAASLADFVVAAVIAAGTVGLYLRIPKGFLPTQDTGIMRIMTIALPNVSLRRCRRFSARLRTSSGRSGRGGCRIVYRRPRHQHRRDAGELEAAGCAERAD